RRDRHKLRYADVVAVKAAGLGDNFQVAAVVRDADGYLVRVHLVGAVLPDAHHDVHTTHPRPEGVEDRHGKLTGVKVAVVVLNDEVTIGLRIVVADDGVRVHVDDVEHARSANRQVVAVDAVKDALGVQEGPTVVVEVHRGVKAE